MTVQRITSFYFSANSSAQSAQKSARFHVFRKVFFSERSKNSFEVSLYPESHLQNTVLVYFYLSKRGKSKRGVALLDPTYQLILRCAQLGLVHPRS